MFANLTLSAQGNTEAGRASDSLSDPFPTVGSALQKHLPERNAQNNFI
jgi:hypothetical protein